MRWGVLHTDTCMCAWCGTDPSECRFLHVRAEGWHGQVLCACLRLSGLIDQWADGGCRLMEFFSEMAGNLSACSMPWVLYSGNTDSLLHFGMEGVCGPRMGTGAGLG